MKPLAWDPSCSLHVDALPSLGRAHDAQGNKRHRKHPQPRVRVRHKRKTYGTESSPLRVRPRTHEANERHRGPFPFFMRERTRITQRNGNSCGRDHVWVRTSMGQKGVLQHWCVCGTQGKWVVLPSRECVRRVADMDDNEEYRLVMRVRRAIRLHRKRSPSRVSMHPHETKWGRGGTICASVRPREANSRHREKPIGDSAWY
jgi:hypothetical protein